MNQDLPSERIGCVHPIAEEMFKAFDPADKFVGFFTSVELAALTLWRAFSETAQEVARIKSCSVSTPTFDKKLAVYAGDALIGTVDVWSDGSATARDGTGKFLGLLPSLEVAVKVCHAEHNDKAGLSSSSLN
jgi:hypothetical protein